MAAKKSKRKAGVSHAAQTPRPQWVAWARYVTIGLMGTIAFALVFPFSSLLPLLTVPFIVGGAIGLWCKKPLPSSVLGVISGVLGASLVVRSYVIENFVAWTQTGLPSYAMQDTTTQMLQFIVDVQKAHPINTMSASSAAVVLLSGLTVGLFAVAVSWLRNGSLATGVEKWVPWAIVALLVLSFAYTAWTGSASFRQGIATEPQDRQYAYDPVFNLKTFYLMRRGEPFYESYVYAIANDSRHAEQKTVVDGKITVGNASALRPPAAFYLWKLVGGAGTDGIVALSILCCAALLAGVYAAFRSALASRALFLSMVLYPGLMLHTTWFNVLFPDWWACLALLASALLLVGRKYWAAGVFAFVAVVFRETFGAWLLVLILAGLLASFKLDRSWWRKTLSYVVEMIVAVALFLTHVSKGQAYFSAKAGEAWSVASLFTSNSAKGLDWKFLAPTSYLMLPYGKYLFPLWTLLPSAAAGFWFGLPRASVERWALTLYPVLMGAFYLTAGATSSYWGQSVMPLAVLGAGLLLARADLTLYETFSRSQAGGATPSGLES